jgi:hypothetical protein
MARNWDSYEKNQKYGTFLIVFFFAVVGASTVFGGGAHQHYLIQLVPFLSLIAGTLYENLVKSPQRKFFVPVLLIGLVALARPVLDQYVAIGKKLAAGESLLSDGAYRIASYLSTENPAGEAFYMMDDHIVHWLTGTQPITKSVTHPSTIGKDALLKAFLGPQASPETEMTALLQKKPLYIVKSKETWYLTGAAAKILEARLSRDYVLVKIIDRRYIYKRRENQA